MPTKEVVTKKGIGLLLDVELEALADDIDEWEQNLTDNVRDALERIAMAWEAGAKQRAPVENGTLRNKITHDVEVLSGIVVAYVGVPADLTYAAFVEFGTKWIAGGRVKALGLSKDITDQEAVKLWPAKNEGDTSKNRDAGFLSTSTGLFHSPTAKQAHDIAVATVLGGGVSEQMPWLRPSFTAIVDQAEELIAYAAGYDAGTY